VVFCVTFVITFPDLEWFSVSRPLSLSKDLRGKIVVLDFFTYCCINCMHILPQLKQLEEQYCAQDGVVVVSESSDS
jgi:thiol-disulfide isomerase/thioredoxin